MMNYRYIYGPVASWRLGSSLGIDLLSQEEKICNFDCRYCQLGVTKQYAIERKMYVSIEEVVDELERLPPLLIDYITFSGRGEPTLAENLGRAIKTIKLIRKIPVAVLTNAALIDREEVRADLALADFVVAKLDAFSPESLQEINRSAQGIEFGRVVEGIKALRGSYQRRLALQIMFIDNNKHDVNKLIGLTNYIKPDEIQINTPLRPCGVRSLTREEIFMIKDNFISACKGINVVSVYDETMYKNITSISDEETLKRRGKIT